MLILYYFTRGNDILHINLYEMLLCISSAVDLISSELSNHHQQVAYLAYHIAKKMGLKKNVCRQLVMAGMVHDIGVLTTQERLLIIEQEPVTINSHAFRSAKLLEQTPVMSSVVETVRYHHVQWNNGQGQTFLNKNVPLTSHILYMADRVCAKFDKNKNPIEQVFDVIDAIANESGSRFMPDAVDALISLKKTEHVWLELLEDSPLDYINTKEMFDTKLLNIDELLDLTRMVSFIIDFRSHFTATHSAGVAAVARKLGELCGFSPNECKMLLIAGYLHDLGKLSIPNTVLEKPSSLNDQEYNIIRGHTFHTYRLLKTVNGLETINQWASFHHEKLNGKGYPFHLSNERIPLGARIMAVADIFTSLTEDRPYRESLGAEQVAGVLHQMVQNGSICIKVVDTLVENQNELRTVCFESQQQEALMYQNFFASDILTA